MLAAASGSDDKPRLEVRKVAAAGRIDGVGPEAGQVRACGWIPLRERGIQRGFPPGHGRARCIDGRRRGVGQLLHDRVDHRVENVGMGRGRLANGLRLNADNQP